MKQDCSFEIGELHLLIRGALFLFEHEGSAILHILHSQKSRYLVQAFSHIGAALLLSNDKLEEILEAPQENGKF